MKLGAIPISIRLAGAGVLALGLWGADRGIKGPSEPHIDSSHTLHIPVAFGGEGLPPTATSEPTATDNNNVIITQENEPVPTNPIVITQATGAPSQRPHPTTDLTPIPTGNADSTPQGTAIAPPIGTVFVGP